MTQYFQIKSELVGYIEGEPPYAALCQVSDVHAQQPSLAEP